MVQLLSIYGGLIKKEGKKRTAAGLSKGKDHFLTAKTLVVKKVKIRVIKPCAPGLCKRG